MSFFDLAQDDMMLYCWNKANISSLFMMNVFLIF